MRNIVLKLMKKLKYYFICSFNFSFPVYSKKRQYKRIMGKKLMLFPPKDLNEKIRWLNLFSYKKNALVQKCANKYLVREYVESRGLKHILNEIYGVYKNPDEIDLDSFPNSFVLKVAHGCKFNIIVEEKIETGFIEIKNQLKTWQTYNYGLFTGQYHYKKKWNYIIAEKFLKNDEGFFPKDFKFYCINGKVEIFSIIENRDQTMNRFSRSLYYRNGISIDNTKGDCKNMQIINRMIQICETLSNPFEFVRVDLYDIDNEIVFGELTFTPGFIKYLDEKMLLDLGEKLKIS